MPDKPCHWLCDFQGELWDSGRAKHGFDDFQFDLRKVESEDFRQLSTGFYVYPSYLELSSCSDQEEEVYTLRI